MSTENNTNNIKLKLKNKLQNQLLSYSTQGELIMKDKCITHSSDNNSLILNDCNGSDSQKWNVVANSIQSENNKEKCIAYNDDDTLSYETCNNTDNQSWQTEQSGDNDESFKWTDYFGKTVVLVEADDPWYLNKENTVQMEYLKTQNLKSELGYMSHADYKTNRIIDENSHNLGFGYSYQDRVGQGCVENFNEGKADSTNVLLMLFCV